MSDQGNHNVERNTVYSEIKITGPQKTQEVAKLNEKIKDVEDCLNNGRYIAIKGDIWENTENNAIRWKKELDELTSQNNNPVVIAINSNGGDLYQVWGLVGELREMLNKKPEIKIYTLGVKYCLSAGLEALMIGAIIGEGIFVTPDTRMQFHGSTLHDNPKDEREREEIARAREFMLYPTIGLISWRTGVDIEEIKTHAKTDKSYTTSEALKLGIIDGIYDKPVPQHLTT